MSTNRDKLIWLFQEDTDTTVVTFYGRDEGTTRNNAQSFYTEVFDIANKGFNPPEPPSDIELEDCFYSSAVTIYYPKKVALEVVHDWLADNSIKFTVDGDNFYHA